MKTSLQGKRAFVTGSSSGIGRAIAVALSEAGADVAVHYNSNREGAEETLAALPGDGRTTLVGGDVSDPETVRGWFEHLDAEWGGLDILVNNAGIDGERQPVVDSETAEWEKVVKINLFGGYYAIREGLKRMVPASSGVVLSVTSVHEQVPWAGQSAYCAAKAGISMLTRSLALELGDCGVRVLCLAPGAIRTDINRDVWSDAEQKQDLLGKIPMRRMGEPEEVGRLAVALVGDEAGSYLTGTTVFQDGGMTAYPSFAEGG